MARFVTKHFKHGGNGGRRANRYRPLCVLAALRETTEFGDRYEAFLAQGRQGAELITSLPLGGLAALRETTAPWLQPPIFYPAFITGNSFVDACQSG